MHACSAALSLDPEYVKAWIRRAYAQQMLHKWDAALKDLDDAMKLIEQLSQQKEKDRHLREVQNMREMIAQERVKVNEREEVCITICIGVSKNCVLSGG